MRTFIGDGPHLTIAHDGADTGGPAVYLVINGDVAIELTTDDAKAVGLGLFAHAAQANREAVRTR